MSNWKEALCDLNAGVIHEFCSAWHLLPKAYATDPNLPLSNDATRIASDFQGNFSNPEDGFSFKTPRDRHVDLQGNVAYIDTFACTNIEFRQGDCVKSCENLKLYTIENVKKMDGGILRLQLSHGGFE
jgi:hypothetical protein